MLNNVYQDLYFEFIFDGCLSKEIDFMVGVKTGDPSRVLLFIVSLDKHLKIVMNKALECGTSLSQISPLPVGGYADDIIFVSHKLDIPEHGFLLGTGLYVRSNKCAILYDRHNRNRWYKSK